MRGDAPNSNSVTAWLLECAGIDAEEFVAFSRMEVHPAGLRVSPWLATKRKIELPQGGYVAWLVDAHP